MANESSKTRICSECSVDKSGSYRPITNGKRRQKLISGVKLSDNSDEETRVQEDVEEFERVLGHIEGSVRIKKLRRITTRKAIGTGSTNKPILVIVEFESSDINKSS